MSQKFKKRALGFPFIPLPKDVVRSPEWTSLPSSAKALVIDLASQYNGNNNGRLCPSFEVMKRYGWSSKDTLARAKKALLTRSFIVMTRKGHPPRTAEWLGLTWWPLHWHESMDIKPTGWPWRNFMKPELHDPNAGRQGSRKPATCVPRNPGRSDHKSPPGSPEAGAMRHLESPPSPLKPGDSTE